MGYEDKEALRLESLEEDLGRIAAGTTPVLRQTRTAWSRVQFYQREAVRWLLWLKAYALRVTRSWLLRPCSWCRPSLRWERLRGVCPHAAGCCSSTRSRSLSTSTPRGRTPAGPAMRQRTRQRTRKRIDGPAEVARSGLAREK